MFGWREDGRKRNKRKEMKTISLFGWIEIQEGKENGRKGFPMGCHFSYLPNLK